MVPSKIVSAYVLRVEVLISTIIGGTVGFFCGGIFGGFCGLLPALLTFGISIPVGALIGCFLGSCTGAFAGMMLGVALVAFVFKEGRMNKVKEVPQTKFFKPSEMASVLPVAPKHYPKHLQGVFWMDQGGVFGHSDVPFTAPDLAFSFGDTEFSTLNKQTRTINVNVSGPAWQWMNNKHGYKAFSLLRKCGFFYHLAFSEDYTKAQIYPCLNLGTFGTWSVPAFLLSFTMKIQQAQPETTLSSSTLYKDRIRYAKWDRESSGLLSPLIGKYGVFHYYVFQIADENHQPIQPFYDACASHALKNSEPTTFSALNLKSPEGAGFVGVYKKAGKMD